MVSGTLDHNPNLLVTKRNSHKWRNKTKLFRFEQKWNLEEEREQLIQNARSTSCGLRGWSGIKRKLQVCSRDLMRWKGKKRRKAKADLEQQTNILQ